MKSLNSSSREMALAPFPATTELGAVAAAAAAVAVASSSDVDSRNFSKLSSLLFRSPFGFLLKGLENLDKHLDELEDCEEAVEEAMELEQASI